ncbi:MAG: hypothetical protein MJ052_02295, partial [Sphaerochaetaceae bacterium]|nr:hypothetical protein [Sphaerochaetaceae bacterium]
MKKIFLLSAVLVMLAVLVSCSSVFSAGLTGTLTDADDDNVAVVGATVYAYTNKSTRDSLYQKYLNDNANLTDVDFAKYASNAISVGKSDAKGEYSLSRAVWHSSSPKYGKTADVTNFYLIIYHEDYCLTTKDIPGVTSDSTNLHVGDEKLLPSKEVTNVTYKINDVGVEGAVFSDTCTMKYVVTSTDPEGKTYDLPVEEVSATGTGAVRVKYPIGNTDVKVKFQLVANGSSWKQTDNTGAYKTWTDPVDVKTTKDKVKNLSMENVLYLKNHEFNMPLFKGYVGTGAMSTDGGDTADDGVTLYLASSTDGANFTVYEGSGVTTSVRV